MAERAHGVAVERYFARGQNVEPRQRFTRALCVRIEVTQAVDLVVEEIDAQRCVAAHGEQVDDGAAHSELAMLCHLRDAQITGVREARRKRIAIERVAGRQRQRTRGHVIRGRQTVQQTLCRHDEQAALQTGQLREHAQALRDDVLMGREAVVGQRLPVREVQHGQCVARKEPGLALEPVGVLLVVRDVQHGSVETARDLHEQQRVGRAGQATDFGGQAVCGHGCCAAIGQRRGAGLHQSSCIHESGHVSPQPAVSRVELARLAATVRWTGLRRVGVRRAQCGTGTKTQQP